MPKWTKGDQDALARAVEQLYSESYLMMVSEIIGAPLEALPERLSTALARIEGPLGSVASKIPMVVGNVVSFVAEKSLKLALYIAAQTTRSTERQASQNNLHLAATAASGAVGGFFGGVGALVEVPFTTTVMFRSILDIARSEGADISRPEVRLECLNVFALGGPSKEDDATDLAYLELRASMAKATEQAAIYLTGAGKKQAAHITKKLNSYIAKVAGRYSVTIGEKAAAELIPYVSAATGAALNAAFMRYYQRIAHGHFTVLRLEEKYGADAVVEAIARIRAGELLALEAPQKTPKKKAAKKKTAPKKT